MEFNDSRVYVDGELYAPFIQDYLDSLLKKAELIESLTPKEKDFMKTYSTFMRKERELTLIYQLYIDSKLTKDEFLAVLKTDEEVENEMCNHLISLDINDTPDTEQREL